MGNRNLRKTQLGQNEIKLRKLTFLKILKSLWGNLLLSLTSTDIDPSKQREDSVVLCCAKINWHVVTAFHL